MYCFVLYLYTVKQKETKNEYMKIPEKLIRKWEALKSVGDAATLADRMTDGYPELFRRAFRTGECSDEVFEVMAEFYKEKAELIKEYL